MEVNIVWRKDQLVKLTNDGAIRERKILGYPSEESPLKAYSSLFYWSHLISEYGCIINDKPIIGFEIFTYVIRGIYETYDRKNNVWNILNEGDLEIIQAGKGTRHSEKIHPQSEVLKIWFDPGFHLHQRINPLHSFYAGKELPKKTTNSKETTYINGKNTANKLYSKDVSIRVENLRPGKHLLKNDPDFTLSVYVIDGFLDLQNRNLSHNDFFSIEDSCELTLNALSDCKLLIISSPLKPEYQTYREMYA